MRNAFPLALILCFALCMQANAAEPATSPMPTVQPKTYQSGRKFFRVLTEKEVKELTSIPTRPWPSPIVSGKIVQIPLQEPPRSNADADLCPHPVGKVKFYTAIALCPYSGFAAYKEDFMKKQPQAVIDWVRQTLTPPMRAELRRLFDLKIDYTDDQLASYFKQEDLPDTIRCEHAFLFYQWQKAPLTRQAKLAWLTAWAYRRALCDSIRGPFVMDSVRRISAALGAKYRNVDPNLEDRINVLAGFYQNTQFPHMDRQVIQIMLAGDYDRLGLMRWSRMCLEQVAKNASSGANTASNPWADKKEQDPKKRWQDAEMRRQTILYAANERLRHHQQEQEYLAKTIELMTAALARKEYAADKIPTYIYMVGEFERRREHFARALLWLQTAEKLCGETIGAEHLSAQQIGVLQDYVKQCGIAIDNQYPQMDQDRVLLSDLILTVKKARAASAAVPSGK